MSNWSIAQKKYINDNNLEGAYNRYKTAYSNWKEHWWSVVVEIWNNCKEWAEKFALDFEKHELTKLVKRAVSKVVPSVAVTVKPSQQTFPKGAELVYLIRLLDRDGELVWSKVGTTTRSIKARMSEHLRYYRKYGVTELEVTRVWDCGNIPAEGLESHFRAIYMKKYPSAFRKNDRFAGVEFDLTEADKIVAEYLGEGA